MGEILSKRKISGRGQAHWPSFDAECGEKQAGNGMVRALSLVGETFFNLLKLNRLLESLQSSCVSSSRKPLAATRWPGSVCAPAAKACRRGVKGGVVQRGLRVRRAASRFCACQRSPSQVR